LNCIEVEVLTWEISALHVEKMPSNLQTKSKIDKIMREECILNFKPIRSDKDVFKIFFTYIKTRIGCDIVCNVIISDVAEAFFNAWIEVMPPPIQR
jgi:hypothetical protein